MRDMFRFSCSLDYSVSKGAEMTMVCRGCGSSDFIDDNHTGDRVCTSCGQVQMQNMLSEEPEWRTYKEDGNTFSDSGNNIGNAEDDARVNTYTESILPETGLSTDFLLDGRNVDSRTSNLLRSMENLQEQRQSRKLLTVHSIMQEAANELDLTVGVVSCAFSLYSQCYSLMHIRGKRSEVIVSSCLYLACRLCSSYRLLSEICDVVLADLRKVTRLSQVIISELKLNIPIPTEEDYIRRYCGVLVLPRECSEMALKLIAAVKEGDYPNTHGSALNAVAVLMATRLCDVESPPSLATVALIASKSQQSMLRLYKAVYTNCDAILVSAYKDQPRMTSKVILKLVQKLDPKFL